MDYTSLKYIKEGRKKKNEWRGLGDFIRSDVIVNPFREKMRALNA